MTTSIYLTSSGVTVERKEHPRLAICEGCGNRHGVIYHIRARARIRRIRVCPGCLQEMRELTDQVELKAG